MKKILAAASVVFGVMVATPAAAEVPFVLAGNSIGTGNNVLHIQAGWPGVSGTFLHGLNDKVDVGGRFTFNYGLEGITSNVNPGLKAQAVIRFELLDNAKYNLGLRVEPGVLSYFDNGGFFGLTLPVGLTFGLPVTDKVMLNFGLDVPFWFAVTENLWVVPILFGPGVEYQLQDNLSLTFNTRFGPSIVAVSGGSATDFTFQSLFGVSWKI